MANKFYRVIGKRLFDILGSCIGLILLTPILVVTSALIAVKLGRPVFFRQTRSGRFGRPFEILKFRSMTDARDANGNLLPDEHRLTSFGKFIREASIDELPALWNVLAGQMSLIGPRPFIARYIDRYTPYQTRRFAVRPGITGLAQVKGRNLLSWEGRFEYDIRYANELSFWLDIKIIGATLGKVINRHGISQSNHATMEEFHGNKAIYVIGAGGHAKVLMSTLRELGYFVEGVFDDNEALWGKQFYGADVLGSTDAITSHPVKKTIIAIGDNQIRRKIVDKFDLPWASIVHPKASVDPSAKIGKGCLIMNGAIVQADAILGDHVIVNTAASVDHDCVIHDFAHLGPGCHLSGGVTVGSGSLLGVGSAAIPGTAVGDRTIVGAGAVIVNDIPAGVIATGVPATYRELRKVA